MYLLELSTLFDDLNLVRVLHQYYSTKLLLANNKLYNFSNKNLKELELKSINSVLLTDSGLLYIGVY